MRSYIMNPNSDCTTIENLHLQLYVDSNNNSVYRTMVECDKWQTVRYGFLSHEAKPSVIRAHEHCLSLITRDHVRYTFYTTRTVQCNLINVDFLQLFLKKFNKLYHSNCPNCTVQSAISFAKNTYHTEKIFHWIFSKIFGENQHFKGCIGQFLWYKKYSTRGLLW